MVDDVEVAGEAGGGVAACEEAAALEPDVVLMDLSMPDLSGIDAMKKIHETRPGPARGHPHRARRCRRRARGSRGRSRGLPREGDGLQDLVVTLHEAADERRAPSCQANRPAEATTHRDAGCGNMIRSRRLRCVGEQEQQPVDPHAESAGGRHAVFERAEEILVERMGFVIAGGLVGRLQFELRALFDRDR